MRAVVQLVTRAAVRADSRIVAEIGEGLLVLVGVGVSDDAAAAAHLADKVANLRIFADEAGKMNLSVCDVQGAVLAVSQFTLFGDARGVRRPSYTKAAPSEKAEALYVTFLEALRSHRLHVESGVFRAMMQVELVNSGPVTILLDSERLF